MIFDFCCSANFALKTGGFVLNLSVAIFRRVDFMMSHHNSLSAQWISLFVSSHLSKQSLQKMVSKLFLLSYRTINRRLL